MLVTGVQTCARPIYRKLLSQLIENSGVDDQFHQKERKQGKSEQPKQIDRAAMGRIIQENSVVGNKQKILLGEKLKHLFPSVWLQSVLPVQIRIQQCWNRVSL